MEELPEDIASERVPAAEAFSVLGNETRIDVLRVLASTDDPMSFTDLREAVAPDDRGNFSYHLGKLTGLFVREVEDGYELRFAGEQVVRAVRAGTITADPTLPPEEIDEHCPFCDAPVEMGYDDEAISARCTDCGGVVGREYPEGTFMHFGFPPAGLAGRTREEVLDAAHVLYDAKVTPMMRGVCPECGGRIDTSFEHCEEHDVDDAGLCPTCETRFEVWVAFECEHCRYDRMSALWFVAVTHPAVVSFLDDHGLDEKVPFRKLTEANARYVRHASATVVDTDPYRFRVVVPVADCATVVQMNEALEVVSVERKEVAELSEQPGGE